MRSPTSTPAVSPPVAARRVRVALGLGLTTAVLTLTACGGGSSATPATSAASGTTPPTTSTSTSAAAPSPTAAPTTSAAQLRSNARATIASITRNQPAHSISIAALNTKTGAHFTAGATHGMWTASCYKLFILETLLLQRQHDDGLSDSEVSQATTMIENSDNVAGYSLFLDIGGNAGLEDAEQPLGMHHTVPGRSDPTFTTTSATDYLSLLKNLVSSDGPLDKSSRSFTLGLMRQVESDQRWGVGVLADPGTDFANKNGWLSIDDDNGPGEQDDGLWAVNSVGIVQVHGQQVLVAIFSQHRPDYDSGIRFVQSLARAIKPVVAR